MRSLLIICLILPLLTAAQSFSSHKIALTPSTRPHTGFSEDAYRAHLYKRYESKFNSSARLAKFIDQQASFRAYLDEINYIYSNLPEETAYLDRLLQLLEPASSFESKLKVHIVRDPQINASMLEDGTMLVNVGLLSQVETEAELLAVFGHEAGHDVREHAYERFKKIANSNAIDQVAVFAGNTGWLIHMANRANLSSGLQNEEREADDYAVSLFALSQLSPKGIENFHLRLIALEKKYKLRKDLKHPLFYFRTHPPSTSRLASARKQIEAGSSWGNLDYIADSVMFHSLKKRATDESINLYFENKEYAECIELAFRQHLLYPYDEFYLFFLTECLRRESALTAGFGTEIFITHRYKNLAPDLKAALPTFVRSAPRKSTGPQNLRQTIFYHLTGPIYNFTDERLSELSSCELLRHDTLEFVTNDDALAYFSSKLNSGCLPHRFSLSCMKVAPSELPLPEGETELEKRYSGLIRSVKTEATSSDRMLVVLGDVNIRRITSILSVIPDTLTKTA
jgi:hypothetical protein